MFPLNKLRQLSPGKSRSKSPPDQANVTTPSSPSKSKAISKSASALTPSIILFFSAVQTLTTSRSRPRATSSIFVHHDPSKAQMDAAVMAFACSITPESLRDTLKAWDPLTNLGEDGDLGSIRRKIALVADGIELCIKEGQMAIRNRGDRGKECKKADKLGKELIKMLEDVKYELREKCLKERDRGRERSEKSNGISSSGSLGSSKENAGGVKTVDPEVLGKVLGLALA